MRQYFENDLSMLGGWKFYLAQFCLFAVGVFARGHRTDLAGLVCFGWSARLRGLGRVWGLVAPLVWAG